MESIDSAAAQSPQQEPIPFGQPFELDGSQGRPDVIQRGQASIRDATIQSSIAGPYSDKDITQPSQLSIGELQPGNGKQTERRRCTQHGDVQD